MWKAQVAHSSKFCLYFKNVSLAKWGFAVFRGAQRQLCWMQDLQWKEEHEVDGLGLMVCAMGASVHCGAVLHGPGDGAQFAASAASSGTSRPGLGFA